MASAHHPAQEKWPNNQCEQGLPSDMFGERDGEHPAGRPEYPSQAANPDNGFCGFCAI
jgi:hypothetical protein